MRGIPLNVLPDYLADSLRVVFCGTAAGKASANQGHYYSGSGNEFWIALHTSGIVPIPLNPTIDYRVLEFGVGLSDLAKGVAAASDRGLRSKYDVRAFMQKIERYRPEWVAFHGKEAAKAVSRAVGKGAEIALGEQSWTVESSKVFVVPNMSGANRDPERLEGKRSRVEWFQELAAKIPPLTGSEVWAT